MTTPTEPVSGLRMPYAVVAKIEPSRDAFRLLPEHENYEGSTPQYRLGVPGGASIIAASYDGPESVRLELSREGISRSLFTIPEKSGGGARFGTAVQIASTSPLDYIAAKLPTLATQAQADAGYALSISVYPIPLPE